MNLRIKSILPAPGAAALVLTAAVLLAGCQTNADVYNDPRSNAFYDRYPIRVANAPVKVGVAAHNGMLSAEQANAVINFAHDARNNATSRVSMRYPSGPGGREAAIQVQQLLVDEGVPAGRIVASSYKGGAGAPVQLSYDSRVAVTKECGAWNDLASTDQNRDYKNFGCAYQQNVAAMVSNPNDFERPRTETPIIAANRTAAIQVYYEMGKAAASTAESTAAEAGKASDPSSSGASGG